MKESYLWHAVDQIKTLTGSTTKTSLNEHVYRAAHHLPLNTPHRASISDDSLAKRAAISITQQTLSQLNAAELFNVLGKSKVCDLFAHCLSSAEGRAMVLTCMSRPRCSELWTNLDELHDLQKMWEVRISQKLARDGRIKIRIMEDYIGYTTPDFQTHKQVRTWSMLTHMYDEFRSYGVTEEEIQCIIAPIAVHMAKIFPDSSNVH